MNVSNQLLKDADDPRAKGWLTLAEGYLELTPACASEHAEHGGQGVDATLKQRGAQWGDAYKQIAGDWNELLGTELTNEDFIAMMLIMKIRRWANSGYTEQDCLTDIIGYAKLGLSLSDEA